jgi:hypothetical protein
MPGAVVCTCKPSTQEAETRKIASFRPVWATKQDPDSIKRKEVGSQWLTPVILAIQEDHGSKPA